MDVGLETRARTHWIVGARAFGRNGHILASRQCGHQAVQTAILANAVNESDSKEEPTATEGGRAFDHVQRRDFKDPGYKTRDVDRGRQAQLLRLAGQSSLAGGAGVLMGFAADMKSEGPVPWILVLPLVCWFVAFVAGYFLMEGAGRFGATLHNPSGRSTPPERQYSAAQALVVRGHYEEAVAAYEYAISEDDSDPEPYLRIARILRDQLEQYEDAAVWFKRAQRHPNAHSGTVLLAVRELTEVYTHRLQDPRRALPILAQLSETRPDSPEGKWAAGELAELRATAFGDPPE